MERAMHNQHLTSRERIWRNIRATSLNYEAPAHLSDLSLLAIAKKLLPLGPEWLDDAETFGTTRQALWRAEDDLDLEGADKRPTKAIKHDRTGE